jgi:hypothetical protein
MNKFLLHKDELAEQFKRQNDTHSIKIEKEIKKENLPINPKFIFEKTPKNIPKKQYRKPKPTDDNKNPKNPFKNLKKTY